MTVATKIGDIIVTIDVNHPVIPVGLGVPGLFIKGDTQKDQVYSSLDALAADYAEGTDIYKVASAYYAQPNAGTTIEVITYAASTPDADTKATTGGISAAAAAYFFSVWHFAVVIGDSDADQLELSNYIEEQNFKFLVAEFPTPDAAKAYTNKRTINLIHKATTDNFPVAFLGRVANQTVGSVTWKGKGDLVGVEVDDLSYPEYAAIEAAHGICYVVKGKKAVSSNGWTASGDWIDVLHGSDWVKVNIESALQDLLNTQDKITFDDLGFAQLQAVVEKVLSTAYANGIIAYDATTKAADYSVTADKYADLSVEDIKNRQYNGIHWSYTPADAVHGMKVGGTLDFPY